MRDYAKISCTIWGSRKFRSLPSDELRLLYLYLHTSQHVNSVGCYVLRAGYALADLGWDECDTGSIRYRNGIHALQDAGLIGYDPQENLVRIVDYLRHDPFCNSKHASGAIKIALKLPDCPQRERLLAEIAAQPHAKAVLKQYSLDTVSGPNRSPEPLPEPLPEPSPVPARDAQPTESRTSAPSMQDRIIAVLGLQGRELNTSGTFVVGGLGQHDLPLRLDVWRKTGLTDDQIIAAITAAVGRERQKDPQWLPKGAKYFDGRIADFAKELEGASAPSQPAAPPAYDDPELATEDAAIRTEWAELEGRKDPEADQLRKDLAGRLALIKRKASPPAKRKAAGG